MTLLTQNNKMKRDSERVFNFGIPAFMAADGFKTCPMAGACAGGCYARQGFYRFFAAKNAYEKRLSVTKSDAFVEIMGIEIERVKPERVRIHDSGDFYSAEYLAKWIAIAQLHPSVKFYAYSKMVKLVKAFVLPENFTVIFSFGGKQDAHIDKALDRHSVVFKSHADLKRSKYADASHIDRKALGRNHRVGLVYHGAESKNWGQR